MTDNLGADGKPLYRIRNRNAPPESKPDAPPAPAMSQMEILDRKAWLANPITQEFFAAVSSTVDEMKADSARKATDVDFLTFVTPEHLSRGLVENAARINALSALVQGAEDILFNQRKDVHGGQ